MKYRNDLNYFIRAHQLTLIEQFDEQIFESGESVYEVMRIHKGNTLFLDEHLNRLQHSMDLIYGQFQYSKDSLRNDIQKLIQANSIKEGNLKLELRKTAKGFIPLLYFIPHRYPTTEQVNNGIRMQFQFDERQNPTAKISNWQVRGNANKIIDTEYIYETLLVNNEGFITEGSRSNIFFIKGEKIFSAPEECILPGITRAKVLDICKTAHIHIIHKEIPYTEIANYEAAFITGTSPEVLQVRSIDKNEFQTNHPIYLQILNDYLKLIYP